MSSRFLVSSSKISTHRRCDNCGITIDFVAWAQCTYCAIFDLCPICAKLGYNNLQSIARDHHEHSHLAQSITAEINDNCFKWILVEEAEKHGTEARQRVRQSKYEQIHTEKKIQNDYDLFIVMEKLKKLENQSSTMPDETELNQINSLIAQYHLQSLQRNINVLSLDGGGVRGYMPIKILSQLISEKFLSIHEKFNPKDSVHHESFKAAQSRFTDQFDYLIGTSTGGLIAFCLAVNYNILDMMDIYANSSYYFKRNYTGPLFYSKYDPSRIHHKIDEIINGIQLKDGTRLSAETATLLDIRNILNPDNIIDDVKSAAAMIYHSNYLEFVDEMNFMEDSNDIEGMFNFHRVKREKVLLITAYNTTADNMTIFNTSYASHWGYRVADVLKATMAAPTYFPPQEVWSGTKKHGHFVKNKTSELYIDGGVFANDPELAALWAIRMQWKKRINYHLLSIGTGCYNTTISSSTWGGYMGWILNQGFLINTLMDATRSFIETIASNLAKFNDIRRMKLNYQITQAMNLDDGSFVNKFDEEWDTLKMEDDYKAFVYFYDTYIAKQDNLGK
ncbi:unnamed protein product [Rotaria socialis]|uniref:PNPLA domain-containing protein n=1 Tax=Rotaria socialis TaxID=392032 RepID=A0A817VXW0_9BILA|nr:unnamed protein product [Rotaria socialis]CAF4578950.1 unnamed protein product [Rotaria socialis]